MPENNKVMFNGPVVMDISDSTVDANNMLAGTVGYSGAGVRTVGTATKGHVIKNPAGTALTQRDNLQFKDAHLSDDSTNLATKVEVVKEVTTAQFANETERGLYRITDKPDSVINAEQVAYGSGNVKQALDGKVYTGSLDDLTATGVYGHNVTSSSNAPSDVAVGTLLNISVITTSLGITTQIAYYGNMRIYVRRKVYGVWNDWFRYNPIKKVTVTGTTSSVGSLAIDNQGHNWIILGFSVTQPTTGSYLFNLGFWNKGNRYIHITDESHNPVGGLSISLDIYYMEE